MNENPYGASNFQVSIGGVPTAGFEECILPTVTIETTEYRQGSDVENSVRKLPGLVRYGDLVLKRGLAPSAGALALWDWIQGFAQGAGTSALVTVTLLDGERNATLQWSFADSIPVKYVSPALNGKVNAIAIESLVIAVGSMKVSAVGAQAPPPLQS
ncbi:MAG: phage tail protein [Nitrososphaerales archaeon]